MKLEVVKHDEAKRAFVLVPRRWAARFRRVARDYERLAATLCGYHWPPFVTRMLNSLTGLTQPENRQHLPLAPRHNVRQAPRLMSEAQNQFSVSR